MKEKATRGVAIIAVGHENYKRMAFNLALSLKVNMDTPLTPLEEGMGKIPIFLLTDEDFFRQIHPERREYFDIVKTISKDELMVNGKVEYQKAKLLLYDYTPFNETIYLDSDSICLPNKDIASLFKRFKGSSFEMSIYNEGDFFNLGDTFPSGEEKKIFWFGKASHQVIRETFGLHEKSTIYNLQSSFFYFKKGKIAQRIFSKAKQFYELRGYGEQLWANGIGDEMAFVMAYASLNYKSTTEYFKICYLPVSPEDVVRDRTFILDNYYFLSMAGNYVHYDYVDFYNTLLGFYHSKRRRLVDIWKYRQKREYLPERIEF